MILLEGSKTSLVATLVMWLPQGLLTDLEDHGLTLPAPEAG